MSWFYLFIGGIFEIVWAIGLKYSEGFTKLWYSVGTVIAMVLSFVFLAKAMKELPVGTAYAIWTGIGALGTATLGIILFNESKDIIRLLCLGLIILGIIGLRLSS